MILINKNNHNYITQHFKESEFFSKSTDIQGDKHKFDFNCINAVEIIRNYYDSKIKITSTFRTPTNNAAVGGENNSLHLVYRAIDFQFVKKEIHKKFCEDIINKGEIFQLLRKSGLGGFIIYKNYIHVDTRNIEVIPVFNNRDDFGYYYFEDKR